MVLFHAQATSTMSITSRVFCEEVEEQSSMDQLSTDSRA